MSWMDSYLQLSCTLTFAIQDALPPLLEEQSNFVEGKHPFSTGYGLVGLQVEVLCVSIVSNVGHLDICSWILNPEQKKG